MQSKDKGRYGYFIVIFKSVLLYEILRCKEMFKRFQVKRILPDQEIVANVLQGESLMKSVGIQPFICVSSGNCFEYLKVHFKIK